MLNAFVIEVLACVAACLTIWLACVAWQYMLLAALALLAALVGYLAYACVADYVDEHDVRQQLSNVANDVTSSAKSLFNRVFA